MANDDKSGLRIAENFARENMPHEKTAVQNLEKDPVGPIKARAMTQSRMRASQETGGKIYDFKPNVNINDRDK